MFKPWHKLRNKSPLCPGSWQGHGPKVAFLGVNSFGQTELQFGGDENPKVGFEPAGLRELAEFCTELADQLDGK